MPFNFDEYVDDVQAMVRPKGNDATEVLLTLKDEVNKTTRNKINRSENKSMQLNSDNKNSDNNNKNDDDNNSKYSQEQVNSAEQIELQIGTKVFVQWRRFGGTEYPGKISHVNSDGTYNIQYDDGDRDDNVTKNRISLTNNNSSSLYSSRLLGLSGLLSGATSSLFLPSFQNLSSRELRSNAVSIRDSESESSGAGTASFEQIALLQIARALHSGNDEIDLAVLLGGDSRHHNNVHQRIGTSDNDNNVSKTNKKKNWEQQIDEKTYNNKSSTYVVVNPNEIIEMLSSIPTTRPVEIYDERVGKVTSYGYK